MQSRHIRRLGREAFQNATTACQGGQLADLLRIIEDVRPGLYWYAADVQTTGPSPVGRCAPTPVAIGNTAILIAAIANVDQFESGVFAGVPNELNRPTFRGGGLWTEDDEAADLCDAVVEVRAFDTTYWLVSTNNLDIADRLSHVFGGRAG